MTRAQVASRAAVAGEIARADALREQYRRAASERRARRILARAIARAARPACCPPGGIAECDCGYRR